MRRARVITVAGAVFLGLCGGAVAFGQFVGPSSSATPYVLPARGGVQTVALLTVGDTVPALGGGGGYRMVGLPDGLGVRRSGAGELTLYMNHEIGAGTGAVRAHGEDGAFVSEWTIDLSTRAVTGGRDLITSVVGGSAQLSRFCSADLPAGSAFYDAVSGKGTTTPLFLNGEEAGTEGRAIATDLTTGTAYVLGDHGKASRENSVAAPLSGQKTVVIGLDDSSQGQLFVYVGDKKTTGGVIERAGLTGGKLYGVKTQVANEAGTGTAAVGAATLVDLTTWATGAGFTLDTQARAAGVTDFARPEDGAWDPARPNDFYWATTGSGSAPSRLYRLRFNDITRPELGGQVSLLVGGTASSGNNTLPYSMDNIGVALDASGMTHILIQEDPGGSSRLAKVWQYTVETGELVLVAQSDATRFSPSGANFITQDEETSGIVPAFDLLGEGWWLLDVQAHYGIDGELVEGGQLLAMYVPTSAVVPEPAGLAAVAMAISGVGGRRSRRAR